nr:hypothetical protein [Pandoravirus aubagnensis]
MSLVVYVLAQTLTDHPLPPSGTDVTYSKKVGIASASAKKTQRMFAVTIMPAPWPPSFFYDDTKNQIFCTHQYTRHTEKQSRHTGLFSFFLMGTNGNIDNGNCRKWESVAHTPTGQTFLRVGDSTKIDEHYSQMSLCVVSPKENIFWTR